jgi:hypothetical protein
LTDFADQLGSQLLGAVAGGVCFAILNVNRKCNIVSGQTELDMDLVRTFVSCTLDT